MTYRPNIARRMANGDDHTAAWLLHADFFKITKGPAAGAWIAWRKGKVAHMGTDHPAGLGCNWYDNPALDTLEKAVAELEENGW